MNKNRPHIIIDAQEPRSPGDTPQRRSSFEPQRFEDGIDPHGIPSRESVALQHNPYANMIAVSNNGVSPHLPFRDWMLRGVVGGVGKMLAWPFQLVRDIINGIAFAILGIAKVLLMIILIPSAIILGLQIAASQSSEADIQTNAASATGSLGSVGAGVWQGLFGPETEAKPVTEKQNQEEDTAKASRSSS